MMEDVCQSEGSTSSIVCESDTASENTSTVGSSTSSASSMIDSSVTPSDLATPADPTHKYEILMTGPNQPHECCFPKRTFSNGNLSFNSSWYDLPMAKNWLEYSPSVDRMFCLSCRLFDDGTPSRWAKYGVQN